MRAVRLMLVLVLCAATVVVVLFGAPAVLALPIVGAFLLLVPGLVLYEFLGVRDGLLDVVVVMMTGPALWGVIATTEIFLHLWHPRITVLAAAIVLGGVAGIVLSRSLAPGAAEDDARHRFRAHPHDRLVFDESGRHKGAFPSPAKTPARTSAKSLGKTTAKSPGRAGNLWR